ncbi:MAG TPA: 50S ribosomal protein L3 N(5)-glutamine methyltransferase [Burkholderiales bacterium]|nr:50S ribosomal protein L3 N(5)-glutamine methyltransferase [Burkholderiales bacterium]
MYLQARTELSTLRDVLRFAVSRFTEAKLAFGHGTDNAFDEAAYLVLHALHLPLDRLDPFLDARLTRSELGRVLDLVERRVIERCPAAYLTHEAWLGDFRFYVDDRVIVPRSFIAELVRERLAPWLPAAATVSCVLDLCTGSGCLAVLLASHFPEAVVVATDVSTGALAVARRNVAEHDLSNRVELVESDVFAALAGRRFDLIVANPPYVTDAAMFALPCEYRREPELALAGGVDGMNVVRRIVSDAAAHLTDEGLLVVEVGQNRGCVEAAFPHLPLIWPETSGGADRVFVATRADLPGA